MYGIVSGVCLFVSITIGCLITPKLGELIQFEEHVFVDPHGATTNVGV